MPSNRSKWARIREGWAEDDSIGTVNDYEGWEDAPVTRWCTECQRQKPIHDFRWRPVEYINDRSNLSKADEKLSELARRLELIEGDEHVYCLYFLSADEGESVTYRLGGDRMSSVKKLWRMSR